MSLKAKIIKLAYRKPELRSKLLPLVKEARSMTEEEFLEQRINNPDTGNKVKLKTLKSKPKDSPGYKAYEKARKRWKSKSKGDDKGKSKSKSKGSKPKTLFSKKEHNLPDLPSQKVSDPDKLFKQVSETHEKQLDWLNRGKGVDKELGAEVVRIDKMVKEGGDIEKAMSKAMSQDGPVIVIGPPKKRDRAEEKVEQKFDGDWSKMTDLVRASVAVESYDDLEDLVKKLKDKGLKLGSAPLNRFRNPTEAGYRDLKLDVEFENGHVGELQLHVKPIIKVKEKAHKQYEKVRSIQSEAKKEGRKKLTKEEQKTVDEANAKMKALYDKAWKKAFGGGSQKKSHVMHRHAARTKYYNYEGTPAYWVSRRFPKLVHPNGEKTFYDLEDFFHNAVPISKREFEKMKKGMDKKSSALRSGLIKLAYEKPEFRSRILPLLKDES